MSSRALIDANVFVTIIVFDLLMRHAELGHFEPIWSQKIIQEADVALTERLKKPWPRVKADHLFSTANEAFENAKITGYEHLVSQMNVEEGDRHVLAAALHGNAEAIITFNLRDFPDQILAKHHIRAIHPDDFLSELRASRYEVQASFVKQMAEARDLSKDEFLARLASTCPKSAQDLLSLS